MFEFSSSTSLSFGEISTINVPIFLDAGITYQGFVMSDAVTATDDGQQEKLFRQAGNIIEKSLEKVRLASFTDVYKSNLNFLN